MIQILRFLQNLLGIPSSSFQFSLVSHQCDFEWRRDFIGRATDALGTIREALIKEYRCTICGKTHQETECFYNKI